MILYCCGPMSDLPEFNYPAFHAAAAELRAAGYVVLNPAETDDGGVTRSWSWYLRRALAQVVQADGVALLPGWPSSRGALLEVHVAGQLGIEIAPVSEWLSAQQGPSEELCPVCGATEDEGHDVLVHDERAASQDEERL